MRAVYRAVAPRVQVVAALRPTLLAPIVEAMPVAEVTSPDELRALHAAVLAPSFPPDELEDVVAMCADLVAGRAVALVSSSDAGVPVAVAVGTRSADVVLLSYLAVAPGTRGGGVGGELYDEALRRWREAFDPLVVLAEIEDPDAPASSADHGDPAARARFYLRRGARVLPVPYVQPALAPGLSRVPGMQLLALSVRASVVADDDAWHLPTEPLRDFLAAYYERAEGEPPTDPQVAAVLAPLRATDVLVVPA